MKLKYWDSKIKDNTEFQTSTDFSAPIWKQPKVIMTPVCYKQKCKYDNNSYLLLKHCCHLK